MTVENRVCDNTKMSCGEKIKIYNENNKKQNI